MSFKQAFGKSAMGRAGCHLPWNFKGAQAPQSEKEQGMVEAQADFLNLKARQRGSMLLEAAIAISVTVALMAISPRRPVMRPTARKA